MFRTPSLARIKTAESLSSAEVSRECFMRYEVGRLRFAKRFRPIFDAVELNHRNGDRQLIKRERPLKIHHSSEFDI
jgi:hypothetical protein